MSLLGQVFQTPTSSFHIEPPPISEAYDGVSTNAVKHAPEGSGGPARFGFLLWRGQSSAEASLSHGTKSASWLDLAVRSRCDVKSARDG